MSANIDLLPFPLSILSSELPAPARKLAIQDYAAACVAQAATTHFAQNEALRNLYLSSQYHGVVLTEKLTEAGAQVGALQAEVARLRSACDLQPPPPLCAWVGDMKTSAGMEYYVCVGFGQKHGQYMTPNMYKIRGRAEYDVAEWNHLLGLGPEPDILAYDTDEPKTATSQKRMEINPETLYYLQDTRSFVGNCPLWWCPDGNGYTTRVDEAAKYTYEDAMRKHRARETDVPWPCEQIDALIRPTIDMQDMRDIPKTV